MNKRILILFAILMGTTFVHAQGPVRDRIKTLKVAFITDRLGLTTEEAQQFWPIYNTHEETLEDIRHKERAEILSNIGRAEDLSDNNAEDLLDMMLALNAEKQKAEKEFLSKMRTVIPAKKVLMLIKAEEDFKKQLLDQYRKRRGGG